MTFNTMEDRGTAGDGVGRQNGMCETFLAGDGGPLFLAVGGRASLEKDRTGRHNGVPRPDPGRTECPVENTDLRNLNSQACWVRLINSNSS